MFLHIWRAENNFPGLILSKPQMSELYPVYILCGPTGVGKSQLANELADKYKGEIISADARQIYIGMDVGTGKLPPEGRKVRHWLLDVVQPEEPFSAQAFRTKALEVLEGLKAAGKKAFMVGGTGLYLKALSEGLFDGPGRTELRRKLEKKTMLELHRQLAEVDPAKAKKLSANDRQRMVRALEVYFSEGKPMSDIEKNRESPAGFKFLWAGLNLERKQLYEKIEKRIEKQFEDGWVGEVAGLMKQGFRPSWPAFKTIGYPEVYQFLCGKLTEVEMVQTIKRKTRQYAKRQLTWFRHQAPVKWFDAESPSLNQEMKKYWGLSR